MFIRARLLYARPRHVPHTNQILVGLPDKRTLGSMFLCVCRPLLDVLNLLNPSHRRKPKINPHEFVDPDPKVQAMNARHLSKYVFARQYGLSNPFVPPDRRMNTFLPDYSDRELEIKVLSFLPDVRQPVDCNRPREHARLQNVSRTPFPF